MGNFKRQSKSLLGFTALLLALMAGGCGSGGGDTTGSGIQITDQITLPGASPAPTAVSPSTTVATSSPEVSSSNPTNGATNVAVSTAGPGNVLIPRTISATFSQAMNPATIVSPASTFTVKETVSGKSVAGSVSLNAANTQATFMPDAVLASNTQFTALITRAATNLAGTALASSYGWSFTTGGQVGQAPINLGTAAGFLVLGGTSIDNISTAASPTRVNGQLGIDPGSTTNVTGFAGSSPAGTGIISTGGIQFGPVVRQAKEDLLAALLEANARTSHQVSLATPDLASTMVNGGSPGVYPPGLYASASTLALSSGNMTLDAKGDPDAVWVFKTASSLTVDDHSQILLRNGAKANNVFWSLGSSANIGSQVSFKGNILAGTSSTVGSASASSTNVEGRVLAVSGLSLYAVTISAPAP